MPASETAEIEIAIEAAREAAELVRTIQGELVSPALTKGDRSPVTIADFAAQALVARRLREALGDICLVGEESAADLRTSPTNDARTTLEEITRFLAPRLDDVDATAVCDLIDFGASEPAGPFWTLDPIDGTKGFLRGDQYAVAIAKIVSGQVILGVLACPELERGSQPVRGGEGSLVAATRGGGTWCQPLRGGSSNRLSVSDRVEPAEARLLRSVEAAHTNTGTIGEFRAAFGIGGSDVPMDSQAKYALLAAGEGDLLVRFLSANRPDYREKIWDQAAGSIVVEEAGGRVSDLSGRPLDFSRGRTLAGNRGVLATNGHLHEQALQAIRRIGG